MLRVHVLAIEYPGYGLYTAEHQRRYKYSRTLSNSLQRKYKQVYAAFKNEKNGIRRG